MSYVLGAVALVIIIALGGLVAWAMRRSAALARDLETARTDLAEARGEVGRTQVLLHTARSQVTQLVHNADLARNAEARAAQAEAQSRDIEARLRAALEEDAKKANWLDAQEQDIGWLRAELEKRPKVSRKTYKVLTLGVKWTGKTSLTLKWANPLVDLGKIEGTKIERYERTVSQVITKEVTTEHVFEIGDWGGEHIVDAQQEMIVDEIHGLLIVVDLGGKDAKAVEPARIQEQLREFQPESLKFFFGPKTVASCKAVVLFINKSDLLPGTPAEAEAEAKRLYQKLINDLQRYGQHVDIKVFVGSANYGHSTHHLFSHFVERILPRNAYDNQLLQRMKSEATPARPGKPQAPQAPAIQAKQG